MRPTTARVRPPRPPGGGGRRGGSRPGAVARAAAAVPVAMLVAGPNLTLDRTLAIAELRPGEVLRFDEAVTTPGGKGVNVARAALALGAPAVLVGFVPGHTGAAAAALLAEEGVSLAGVEVGGEIRP